jgi:hypothetical protein
LDGPNQSNETDAAASDFVDALFNPIAPADPLPSAAAKIMGVETGKAARRPQWSARLARNPRKGDGNPPYVLMDRYGGVQRYVEPVPQVDLDNYVGQTVAVRRDTGGTLLASQLDLPRRAAPRSRLDHGVTLAAFEELPEPDLAEGAATPPAPAEGGEIIDGGVVDGGPIFEGQGEPMMMDGVDPLYLDGGHGMDHCTECGDAVCGCGEGCGGRPLAYVRGEYLIWWFEGMDTPPLVVSSADPIFDENDPVIFGGDDILDGSRSGGRVTLGVWLDDCGKWALEFDYFAFSREELTFSAGSFLQPPPPPYIGRPFFDVEGDPVTPAAPGPAVQEVDTDNLNGVVTVDIESEFQSAGVRLRRNLCCAAGCTTGCGDCVTCGSGVGYGADCPFPIFDTFGQFLKGATRHVDMTFGVRWSSLDEGLRVHEDLFVVQPPTEAGTRFQLTDSFATSNEFLGGEVGFIADWEKRRWSLELLSRLAIGSTKQRVFINGETIVTPVTGPVETFPGFGLLAQPSNVGAYERDEFSVIPEIGVTVGYLLTDRLRLTAGYTLLFWTSVVRPGEQIDFDVNSAFLDLPADPSSVDPQRPLFAFDDTDIWAQGFSFGVDYRW